MKTINKVALCAILGIFLISGYFAYSRNAMEDLPIINQKVKTDSTIRGDYNGVILNNRHVDTPEMIEKLKALNINTYYYIISNKDFYWDDFRNSFLPAAQKAGINCIVYLTPPSSRYNEPFGRDYVAWAEAIAKLSKKYPALKGYAMDDFVLNIDTFTPSYVSQMHKAALKINPKLTFSPVLYYEDIDQTFLDTYAPYFDTVIFPYKGWTGVNELKGQLDHVIQLLNPFDLEVILMVYATKHSRAPHRPGADYVRKALQIGLNYTGQKKLAGVTTYKLTKASFESEACDEQNFSNYLMLKFPKDTPASRGNFASAGQQIRLDPTAESYEISFWQQDTRAKKESIEGYHIKQLLVNGQVAWERDAAGDAALQWIKESVDITSYINVKSAANTISFRLYENRNISNVAIGVGIADIQPSGFDITNQDFSNRSGWKFDLSSSVYSIEFMHDLYKCNPNRQLDTYNAVKKLFNNYGSD